MPTIAIADIPYTENLRVAEIVQGGIPARALKKFADALSLNMADLARIVLIPRRTLERRMASNSLLRTAEAERVVRLAAFRQGRSTPTQMVLPSAPHAPTPPMGMT